MRTVAIEVSPLHPETLARMPLRFTDHDDARTTILNGGRCWPGIMRNLSLNREGWNGDWQNNVAVPQAAFDVSLGALRKADALSPLYRWAGAPITVYTGAPGALELLFEGLVDETTVRDGILKISGTVNDEPFLGDVLSLKYDGRGTDTGDEGLAEKPKPACFGFCRNLEPVQINAAEYIYQVHGYGPIEEVVAVFERGIDFGVGVGDFPTYDALLAASVPEGRWATCLAHGLLRMGAPPAGVLTCDVKGDNTGGFHQSTAAIVRRLLELAAVPADRIDEDSLDAFEAAVPYPINVYVTGQETTLNLIARLALPCNAQTSFSWVGKLQISRFATMPTPTFELNVGGAALPPVVDRSEQALSAPMWRLEMQYGRAWRPQTKDEIVLEEEVPEPQPVSVWRRFPTQPERPTGNGIPDGWSTERPQFETPAHNINDPDADEPEYLHDTVLVAGPIWRSGAMQRSGETTEDGWDYPTLDDPHARPFSLATMTYENMVLVATDAVAAAPQFEWYGAGVGNNSDASVFIPEGINGPFNLSFRVRKGNAMFSAGIMNLDPRTLNPNKENDTYNSMFAGILALNNDATFIDMSGEPLTGIYPFSDEDMSNGYIDDNIGAYSNELPQDDTLYQMTFNGHVFDFYVDGELARTYAHNMAVWATEGFWPLFCILDPAQEIYDIQWEPGEIGQTTGVGVGYSWGAMRYRQHLQQWELFTPNDLYEGFGYSQLETRVFKGEGKLSFETNVPGSDEYTGSNPGFTQFAYLYDQTNLSDSPGFRFKSNGEFGYINEPQSTPTSPYSAGDSFSVEIKDRVARYFHNGELTRAHLVAPGRSYQGYFEMGKGGYFRRFDVRSTGVNGTAATAILVEAATWENVLTIADATVSVTGTPGYCLIATTPDLNFTVQPYTDLGGAGTSTTQGIVRIAAAFEYRATIGSGQPYLILQMSINGGGSWSFVAQSPNNVSNVSADPADVRTISVGATQTQISGTQSRRYRLLAAIGDTVPGWELSIENLTMTAEFSQ